MIDFEKEYPEELGEILMDKIDETEIIILKCHLVIEYALNHLITKVGKNRLDIDKARFTFSNKTKIAQLLGLFERESDELKIFINDLNKIRNQIAHSLSYDEKLIEKICNYPDSYDEKKWKNKSDFLKVMIRIKTSYMCGMIKGSTEKLEKE